MLPQLSPLHLEEVRKFGTPFLCEQFFSKIKFGPAGSVLASGPGDLGSIPDRVIPKTLKMVLDTFLLITQQYKVRIKDKVEQSREKSSALGVEAIEKGAFWSPSTMVANFTYLQGRYVFNSQIIFCHMWSFCQPGQ